MKISNINYGSKVHLLQLDGLRGLAIILVLFNHVFTYIPMAILGWTGVDLFFVLSGFLITGILIESRHKSDYYKTFIKRRALRIFPLYYFFLLMFFFVYPKLNSNYIQHYESLSLKQTWFWSYTSNFFFAFNGWPANQMLDHFWSLAVEEQFYLIWPFIILYAQNKNIIIWSTCLIVASIFIRNIKPSDPFAITFTFCRLDSLSIGAVFAVLIRHYKKILEKYTFPTMLTCFVILLLIGLYTGNLKTTNICFVRIGFTLFDLFFACLLIISLDDKFCNRFFGIVFSLSFLRFFGKYSYGIYIYHWPFYHLFYKKIFQQFQNFYNNRLTINILTSITLTIFVIIFSLLSYHLLEKPFLSLKNKLVSA